MKKYIVFSVSVVIAAAIGSVGGYAISKADGLRETVDIYSFSHQGDNTVSTFDDRGNKCYIATGRTNLSNIPPSISCVRMSN